VNRTFTASEVEKITGVKRTRLQQWLEKNYIVPSVHVADGYGTRNIYSIGDVYRIEAFKRMVEGGLLREKAARLIKTMIDAEDHGRGHLIISFTDIDGKSVLYGVHDDQTDGIKRELKKREEFQHILNRSLKGLDVFVFDFGKVMDYVDSKIKEV